MSQNEFMDDEPVTRRQFREGLAELRTELKGDIAELRTDLRTELRTDLQQELAHQFKLIQEHFSFQFRAVDDQYSDLPRRVARLEDAVFPPKPTPRRRKS